MFTQGQDMSSTYQSNLGKTHQVYVYCKRPPGKTGHCVDVNNVTQEMMGYEHVVDIQKWGANFNTKSISRSFISSS